MPIKAIAAMAENRVIGRSGDLPWRLPEDLKRFKSLTSGHTVLLGRKTFDSLKVKPLPGRRSIVVTHDKTLFSHPEVVLTDDLEGALRPFQGVEAPLLWVLGGEEIYRQTLPFCDEIELTVVPGSYDGDAFFPPFEEDFDPVRNEEGVECRYVTWTRKGCRSR